MSSPCGRCDGTGFLNTHQLPESVDANDDVAVLAWIKANSEHDVQVCDCCGNGEYWYGEPGMHDPDENFGLIECL